jgi:hypothetical protein
MLIVLKIGGEITKHDRWIVHGHLPRDDFVPRYFPGVGVLPRRLFACINVGLYKKAFLTLKARVVNY